MRNTDPEQTPYRPLGEKVTPKPTPQPSQTTWQPRQNAPGIEIDSEGRMRTNIPANNKCYP